MGGGSVIYTTMDSPIGELLLLGDGDSLHGLYMQAGKNPIRINPQWVRDDEALAEVRDQLEQYFAGERTTFDIKIHLDGTAFQRTVWHELTQIPYGETISYGADCGWMFVDRSRNRLRRWCQMETCGTMEKTRRRYGKGQ